MDTGQEITVPNEMTLKEIVDLEYSTIHRFHVIEWLPSNLVKVGWRNYIKPRSIDKNMAWRLFPYHTRVIKWTV